MIINCICICDHLGSSKVIWGWDHLKSCRIGSSGIILDHGIIWAHLGSSGIIEDLIWDHLGPSEIIWAEIIWNHLVWDHFGIILGSSGIIWDHLGPSEIIIWNHVVWDHSGIILGSSGII